MINRRSALTVAPALAAVPLVAGCATIEKWTGTTTPQAATQAVLNEVQFILPLVDALALGISVAVPGLGTAMGVVIAGVANAGPIFQTLQATMTTAEAQPIVQQIEGYVAAGVAQLVTAVQKTPALAAYATRVQQAQAVVALLTTFVNGVVPAPAVAARYRGVALPLLHS